MLFEWNEGENKLIGGAFIPQNRPPAEFRSAPLPCTFAYQGNAYRKIGVDRAIRLKDDSMEIFLPETLVYPQTNIKAIWQNAYGVNSQN